MSSSNSKNGLVPTPRQGSTIASQRPQAAPQPSDHIIAQFPDLAPAAAVATKKRFPSGRIISQALSMKLVFGVGAALVVGAVLPFAFNKVTRPKPVQELPAWNGQTVQTSSTQNTAETVAPAWNATPAKQTTVVVPPQPVTTGISAATRRRQLSPRRDAWAVVDASAIDRWVASVAATTRQSKSKVRASRCSIRLPRPVAATIPARIAS